MQYDPGIQKTESRSTASYWRRALFGPLLTCVAIGVLQLLKQTPLWFPNPPAVLIIFVVFAAFTGGVGSGLLSATIAWFYFAYHFSGAAGIFRGRPEDVRRIWIWLVATPAIALLTGLLKRRADRLASQILERERQHSAALSAALLERTRAQQEIADLNRALAQRAEQLEKANKELESFSYSVSHDLRSPLRAMSGYSRIVLEQYSPKLDDEGRRMLARISRNAEKMDMLISDLLTFSRLGRQALVLKKIDMRELFFDVCAELKSGMQNPPRCSIPDLPPAQGDAAMLRQVAFNLLANAIKFSRKNESPFIEVGARQNGEVNVYFVKDNGVGFEMQYANKLFGVFQRLHSESEFEGTGVGLALVHRIIERHSGKVWAESELGKGATFYFTLPAAPRENPAPIIQKTIVVSEG